jgi:hypothetical protein
VYHESVDHLCKIVMQAHTKIAQRILRWKPDRNWVERGWAWSESVNRGLERVEASSESGLGDSDKAGATRPSHQGCRAVMSILSREPRHPR